MSSGKSNKQNFSRKRKKKLPLNKYSRINLSNISPEKVTSSISKKRLIIDQTNLNTKSELIRQEDDYFLFVNFSILKSLFQPLLVCPECEIENEILVIIAFVILCVLGMNIPGASGN